MSIAPHSVNVLFKLWATRALAFLTDKQAAIATTCTQLVRRLTWFEPVVDSTVSAYDTVPLERWAVGPYLDPIGALPRKSHLILLSIPNAPQYCYGTADYCG
jgi:hypothetical protein